MARPLSYERESVIDAAERQFRRAGYEGTSVDDLVDATGLGRGSLYAAFGGKHDLYLETLDRYCDSYERSLEILLTGDDASALVRLRTYLSDPEHCSMASGEYLVCLAGRSAMELGDCDPDVRARVDRNFRRLEMALTTVISAAQRAGSFDPQVPASAVATTILVILKGVDIVARSGRAPDTLRPILDAVVSLYERSPQAV